MASTHVQRRLLTVHRADPLGVSQDRILLAETEQFAVVLQDLLERRDGRVALDNADARRERHNDGNGELEIALARFLPVRKRAARGRRGQ